MVRIFIGILVPSEIRNNIISVQKKLNNLAIKAKMVEPENLHISLSFLGEIDDKKVDEISGKLDSIAKNYQKFEITISGIKFIPNENYFRVLAFDVLSPENVLRKEIVKAPIIERISSEIRKEIGGDVKPPHLTICRVRSIGNKNLVIQEIIKRLENFKESFKVNSIQILESTLQRSGPIYSVIHESRLS